MGIVGNRINRRWGNTGGAKAPFAGIRDGEPIINVKKKTCLINRSGDRTLRQRGGRGDENQKTGNDSLEGGIQVKLIKKKAPQSWKKNLSVHMQMGTSHASKCRREMGVGEGPEQKRTEVFNKNARPD